MKKIISVLLVVFSIGGCEQAKTSTIDKSLAGIKLKDLAPAKKADPNLLPAISYFTIYAFKVPASSAQSLALIWQSKDTRPVVKSDPDAFASGDFAAISGEGQQWNAIAAKLNEAGGQRGRAFSLIIPQSKGHFLALSNIDRDVPIFFPNRDGNANGVTLGQGSIGFYIRANAKAGPKGMCDFTLTPAFQSDQPKESSFREPQEAQRIGFNQLGISMRMSAEGFILLGPQYIPQPMSAAQLYFEQDDELQLYLIVCTRVVD